MSEGIIQRLRNKAKENVNETAIVYPGDIIEIIDEMRSLLSRINSANAAAHGEYTELWNVNGTLQERIDRVLAKTRP